MSVAAYRHEPGCTLGVSAPHWHHVCWYCGTDLCGYTCPAAYSCKRCGCEENSRYTSNSYNPEFDPGMALRLSSPA